MTLLEAVNGVLVELRENEVESLDGAYAKLLVRYVNRAKRWAEDEWDWKVLRSVISFSTVINQVPYTLTGTNRRSRIMTDMWGNALAFNLTDGTQLARMPREMERTNTLLNDTPAGQPSTFSTVLTASGLTFYMYPKPQAVYSMSVVCKIPQADLSATTDEFTCPAVDAIVLKAAAWAAAERGGGQGTEAATLDAAANSELSISAQLDGEVGDFTAREM